MNYKAIEFHALPAFKKGDIGTKELMHIIQEYADSRHKKATQATPRA